ncbi:hypothetical protein [Aeromicrobium fastidiosum]|uniref:Uncharacterized protein n=1 Tax=Aeromicrobium fastidiosum TaxID=52699 RepID=A0A641AIA1_9ACTN|nr:hypothetical protein [Aeromicrobium fastidiosum]KAA1374599.1 hypothetical protein ESP62_014485 [Aeromicrobium fastidiosum]MBP2390858.1 hypothetical protein [Aeromicrobium fastidiosum]
MKKLVGAFGVTAVAAALLIGPSSVTRAESAQVPNVAVAGSPAVGSTLQVVPAAWGTPPTRRVYEWLRDGEGDVLSNEPTYTLTDDDVGHTMVVVERVWFGTTEDETSSAPVVAAEPSAPVAAPAPAEVLASAVNVRRPTVKGSPKVGKKLAVRSKGTWTAPGHRFTYQWLRNGKVIKKATRTTYRLTAKDRRKKISVRVSASRAGLPTVSATSSRTKAVR